MLTVRASPPADTDTQELLLSAIDMATRELRDALAVTSVA